MLPEYFLRKVGKVEECFAFFFSESLSQLMLWRFCLFMVNVY